MTESTRIGDLIATRPVRTVVRLSDLDRPGRATELLEAFLVTEDAARLLAIFLGAVERREGGGFFLQGNFGSGKSHTLTVVAQALRTREAAAMLSETLGKPLNLPPVLLVTISLVDFDARRRLEDIVAEGLSSAWTAATGEPLVRSVDERLLGEIRRRAEEQHGKELALFLEERKLEADALFTAKESAHLEELIACCDLPYRLTPTRRELWDDLKGRMRARDGFDGVVVLLDELSEFLRSKPDDRSFQEDVRFLQFLGERTTTDPLWILATLQEWIEETGEIKQETFQKIKDRYPHRFRLSGRHVEELVTKRLVRKKPNAEEKLLRLWENLTEAFGEVGFTAETFAALYPVHPGTLRLLDELRPLFSQHRGVVDFIHYQLAGDPTRAIDGMLKEPATSLLTADRIFDHFELRLREIVAYRPYIDTVYSYFVREVERILPQEADRVFGLRALKLCILAEMSPREEKPSCRRIAQLLVNSVTDLDSEANYEYVADILGRMERDGAYLERIAGPKPVDDVYRIRPQADLALLLTRKVRDVAERLNWGDPRLLEGLLPLADDTCVPLARFTAAVPLTVTFRWQGTRRSAEAFLGHLAAVRPEDLARWRERIEAGDVDFVLFLGLPLDRFERDPIPPLTGDLPENLPFAFWVPGPVEILEPYREAFARVTLRATLAEEKTVASQKLVDRLNTLIEEDQPRLCGALRSQYLQGRLVLPNETVDPSTVGMRPLAEFVSAIADRALSKRHPRHRAIAPKTEINAASRFTELMHKFFTPGALTPEGARTLQTLIEGYLQPLGLIARTPQGLQLRVDPDRCSALRALMGLLEERPDARIAAAEVERFFRRGPFGMCEDQYLLFMAAVLSSGQLTAWTAQGAIPAHELSTRALEEMTALGPGDILPESLRVRIKDAPFLPAELRKRDCASLTVQEEVWDAVIRFGQEVLSGLADLRQLADRHRHLTPLAHLSFGELLETARSVETVVAAIDPQATAREGLERFLCREGEHPSFPEHLDKLSRAREFLMSNVGHYLQAAEYALGARAVLHTTRDEASWEEARNAYHAVRDTLRRTDMLTNEEALRELAARFDLFLESYLPAYREAHEKSCGEHRFTPYRALRTTPVYRLLRRLAAVELLTAGAELAAFDRRVEKILGTACRGLRLNELRIRPVCRCGFAAAPPGELPPPDELATRQRELLALALEELRTETTIRRVCRGIEDLRTAERHEQATRLEKLIRTPYGTPEEMSALAEACDESTIRLLDQSLNEGLPVVTRDVTAFAGRIVGKMLTPEALEEFFKAWLYGESPLPPGTVVRVSQGAETDELSDLPCVLRERFPEVVEEMAARGGRMRRTVVSLRRRSARGGRPCRWA